MEQRAPADAAPDNDGGCQAAVTAAKRLMGTRAAVEAGAVNMRTGTLQLPRSLASMCRQYTTQPATSSPAILLLFEHICEIPACTKMNLRLQKQSFAWSQLLCAASSLEAKKRKNLHQT